MPECTNCNKESELIRDSGDSYQLPNNFDAKNDPNCVLEGGPPKKDEKHKCRVDDLEVFDPL